MDIPTLPGKILINPPITNVPSDSKRVRTIYLTKSRSRKLILIAQYKDKFLVRHPRLSSDELQDIARTLKSLELSRKIRIIWEPVFNIVGNKSSQSCVAHGHWKKSESGLCHSITITKSERGISYSISDMDNLSDGEIDALVLLTKIKINNE